MRQASAFRSWIEPGSEHPPEPGRYHLYVSYACPWAHRTIIARRLKCLEHVVGLTAVDPIRDERGWRFSADPDPLHGWAFLSDAYATTDPAWQGRVTVPVLWDCHAGRIVNNESGDIVRMLDRAFDEWATDTVSLCPPELEAELDAMRESLYVGVNNAVYRAGFATSQEAYDEAAGDLAEGLAAAEAILAQSRWLVANRFTEADVRLFTTLVRFDPVYHTHFKCNGRLIADSPTLLGFLRDVAQVPGVMDTIRMDEIKRHYYLTHDKLNPAGIVPVSDGPDLSPPHGRGHLGPEALAA